MICSLQTKNITGEQLNRKQQKGRDFIPVFFAVSII